MGLRELMDAKDKGELVEADIVKLHNAGYYGLQLPALAASTLNDWGIRPVPAEVANYKVGPIRIKLSQKTGRRVRPS